METFKSEVRYRTVTGHMFSDKFEAEQFESFIKEFGKAFEIKQAGRVTRFIVVIAEKNHTELAQYFLSAGMGPMFEFEKGVAQTAANLKQRWGFRQVPWEVVNTDLITDILAYHEKWNNKQQNPFKTVEQVHSA